MMTYGPFLNGTTNLEFLIKEVKYRMSLNNHGATDILEKEDESPIRTLGLERVDSQM